MLKQKIYLSFKGGILGTIVLSLLIMASPMIGFPRMPIWEVLARLIGAPVIVGWIAHFAVGIVLAGLYVFWFKEKLKGNHALRGMIFSLLPFALAQIAAIASGGFDFLLLLGSLLGHLAYGLVLGLSAK